MAKETITKCDGCGTAASGDTPIEVGVQVSISDVNNAGPFPTKDYDLCDGCLNRLHGSANPTTWERKKRRTRKAKA